MKFLATCMCIYLSCLLGCLHGDANDSASRRVATLDPPPVYTPCSGCELNETDTDCDGLMDGDNGLGPVDNCPQQCNPNQEDAEGDGLGDVCDPCDLDPADDIDNDGICAGGVGGDNCPAYANFGQEDEDVDGFGVSRRLPRRELQRDRRW
jgi:hypothetical protein